LNTTLAFINDDVTQLATERDLSNLERFYGALKTLDKNKSKDRILSTKFSHVWSFFIELGNLDELYVLILTMESNRTEISDIAE